MARLPARPWYRREKAISSAATMTSPERTGSSAGFRPRRNSTCPQWKVMATRITPTPRNSYRMRQRSAPLVPAWTDSRFTSVAAENTVSPR